MRPDQRERSSVGAEHDRRNQAERSDHRCRDLRQQHLAKCLRRRRAERFGSGELRAIEVHQHRQHADHNPWDEVVRRCEGKSRRREQRPADGCGVESGAREQLRHEAGAAVAQDEAIGDDQAGESERQRDHERERRAPVRRQARQIQRHRDADERGQRRGDQRQRGAATERGPESGSAENARERRASFAQRVDGDRQHRQREEQREQKRAGRSECELSAGAHASTQAPV